MKTGDWVGSGARVGVKVNVGATVGVGVGLGVWVAGTTGVESAPAGLLAVGDGDTFGAVTPPLGRKVT